ncbi:MAG: xanthine dehydrogenase accessory protein XdhC [Alphaproteobacteria bacterium]|nr:xanthine dehydrogenase accessory protein XdhC [Alphaproteobacteria bacterium]
MSFDLSALHAAIARQGPVARVVIARVAGSAPREVGASMLVWSGGQSGTIGGGALELAAAQRAREALTAGRDRFDQVPLGPGLGQCCGGSVGLLTEIWDKGRLPDETQTLVTSPLPGTGASAEMPLAVRRLTSRARNAGAPLAPALMAGWMIEPVAKPARQVWIYGAGHVGRAIVSVLAPLPGVAITWVDTGPERYPEGDTPGVTKLVAANPADAVRRAPPEAEHYVLTYSHAFDLEICHRILGRPFAFAGLIGSTSKWARFRKRLAALGHGEAQIARIHCPIGDTRLGKHPQAIAIGIAQAHLERGQTREAGTTTQETAR